jgi:2-polyprenyl-3-methyl-5-hydroxy-6-metoxy-1,4-benzoquinol methylase
VACNLCGEQDCETLFQQDQHGLGLCTVMCRQCGLIYLNPRPTAQDYDGFYRDWYHRLYPSRAAFHSGALGGRIVVEAARLRRDAYEQYLSGPVRLLEVGCGEGAFLKALEETNPDWDLQGIDLAPVEVAACHEKGLPVVCGRLEDFPSAPNTHVAAFHVLEHSLDPQALLQEMANRIAPDGYLFLEVPNILGSWQGLGMIHVAHPYQFALPTLTAMIAKAGLSVIHGQELEHPLFPSSLRIVAQHSRIAGLPVRSMPSVAEVQARFRRKLARWRRDLAMNWLVRQGTPWFNSALRNWFWEQTAGRRWQARLFSAAEVSNSHP